MSPGLDQVVGRHPVDGLLELLELLQTHHRGHGLCLGAAGQALADHRQQYQVDQRCVGHLAEAVAGPAGVDSSHK